MYENIETDRPNFCIGPQAGTYCVVDNEVSPVVMHVKNDSGVLIRTYTFYPQTTLHTGPKDIQTYPILPSIEGYSYHDFVTIQYVGPYDQASYYDGAVFYTLERRALGRRKYYTYDNPNDLEEYDYRVEYDSNIVRKWVLDNTNFRLVLDNTYYYNSDTEHWFDAQAFAINNSMTSFNWHSAANTGEIEIAVTTGLKKYDTLFLGPSSDTSNVGKVEEVYVHSIYENTVEIRTYGGEIPTIWEYMQYDPITIHKDIFLFSNPRPLIDDKFIAYGYSTPYGTLYRTDPNNYGTVLETDYNGIYCDVVCATWNNYYSTLSFIKGANLLHLDVVDYEISRSQDMHLENPSSQESIPVFDIDMKEESIYKLQTEILQHDDDGNYFEIKWDSYNYHTDSLIPYTNSVTLFVSNRILSRQGQSFVSAVVRDQFGVGLLSKNVWFTHFGDIAGELTPSSGYVTSDADGKAVIQYDAGSNYTGNHSITVKVDGGNNIHGSVFVVASTDLQQYSEFNSFYKIRSVTLDSFSVKLSAQPDIFSSTTLQGKVAYVFPGNLLRDNDMSGWESVVDDTSLIVTKEVPTLGDDVSTTIKLSEMLLNEPTENEDHAYHEIDVTVKELKTSFKHISSNFVSRHLSYGHLDSVTLNQFIFIQDVRPSMWSEKNNVNTDFWIRLRPFATSLNPASLIIRLREESYLGDHGWMDVTSLGTLTMFDAGGGIMGIDFIYSPSERFHHDAVIYVDIVVYDTSPIPNIITVKYWFKIIQDYKAPYIVNNSPSVEAFDVPVNTPISFDLVDLGEGTDINSLELFINNRASSFTYDEYESGNYHIYCEHDVVFNYGESVTVDIKVLDRSNNKNKLLTGWKFYCVGSTGPWIDMDNTIPSLCLKGTNRKQPVSAQIYGINDTGIQYESIKLEVGGKYRDVTLTPIVYRLN